METTIVYSSTILVCFGIILYAICPDIPVQSLKDWESFQKSAAPKVGEQRRQSGHSVYPGHGCAVSGFVSTGRPGATPPTQRAVARATAQCMTTLDSGFPRWQSQEDFTPNMRHLEHEHSKLDVLPHPHILKPSSVNPLPKSLKPKPKSLNLP